MSNNLRPCFVLVDSSKKGKKQEKVKGLFHCWMHMSNVVGASPFIGGHPSGVISYTVGLVELEDGRMAEVLPDNITFIGNVFKDYAWSTEEE